MDQGNPSNAPKKVSIHALLRGLVKYKASDLHVKFGRPALYRVNGNMIPADMPQMSAEEVKEVAYSTMTSRQITQFERDQQIDFGYVVPGLARFRANVFMQRGMVSMVVRLVPLSVPVLDTLGLPPVIAELALKERGLLLVTGATGSGKSTTLAAMVDHVNRQLRKHIITIEDPIEYVHDDKLCTVSQRELGIDAPSFPLALRAALRQDPDVILVGELRDYETIQTAISAAETGHLVMATLHTNSCAQTLDRILDIIPADARHQARMQLSSCLTGIVNQRLVRRSDGKGRMVACEVMVKSPTIEKLIVDNKIGELEPAMEASSAYYKMQTMNQALERMVRSKQVTLEEAILHSDRQEDLRLKLSGMVGGGQRDVEAGQLMQQALAPDSEATDPGIEVGLATQDSGIALENAPTHKQNGFSPAATNMAAANKQPPRPKKTA